MRFWSRLESDWEESYKYDGRILTGLSQPEIN